MPCLAVIYLFRGMPFNVQVDHWNQVLEAAGYGDIGFDEVKEIFALIPELACEKILLDIRQKEAPLSHACLVAVGELLPTDVPLAMVIRKDNTMDHQRQTFMASAAQTLAKPIQLFTETEPAKNWLMHFDKKTGILAE